MHDDRQPAPPGNPHPAYSLGLDAEEVAAAAEALRLLITGESHEPTIRAIARHTLTKLSPGQGDQARREALELSEAELKIFHTAVKILLDDLRRDQAEEQRVLMRILQKLPDEHAIRAITLQ